MLRTRSPDTNGHGDGGDGVHDGGDHDGAHDDGGTRGRGRDLFQRRPGRKVPANQQRRGLVFSSFGFLPFLIGTMHLYM